MFAFFLQNFPGYTAEDVMNEYAIRFFALCKQAARLRAVELLELAEITVLPHLKKHAQQKLLQDLQKKASPEKYHDIEKDRQALRRIMRGGKL